MIEEARLIVPWTPMTVANVQAGASYGSLPALGFWLHPKAIDQLFEEQPYLGQ